MSADAIWQAFAETGDPLYYLLYKSADAASAKKQEKNDDRQNTEIPAAQA